MESGGYSSVLQYWQAWVYPASIQIAALVVLIFAVCCIIPKSLPRIRFGLWGLVFIKALLPPTLALSIGVGNWGADLLSTSERFLFAEKPYERSISPGATGSSPANVFEAPSDPQEAFTGGVAVSEPGSTSQRTRVPVLWYSWISGLILFLGLSVIRYVNLVRRLNRGEAVEEGGLRIEVERLALLLGAKTPPRLILSSEVDSPFLCGLFKPRIVLPKHLPEDLSQAELRNVLLHELVHWKRKDLVVGWIQGLVQAVYWFHPFVWFANTQMRHERERIVDDTVLALGEVHPKNYGESILKVLLASEGRSAMGLGLLGIFERNTQLQKRMEGIMTHKGRSIGVEIIGWIAVLLFAALFLPMGPVVEGAEPEAATEEVVLRHDDGTSDGKMSFGGAAHAERFECPGEGFVLTGVEVYGSRYGYPEPPDEDFTIHILGPDAKASIAKTGQPYSLFERGDPKWILMETDRIELPKSFWLVINFNAHQTKGVYVHYDSSSQESFSKKAVPTKDGYALEDTKDPWNWMIRAHVFPKDKAPPMKTSRIAPPSRSAPAIVSTSPKVGERDVDPALAEITVTFDQPMNTKGYSWTGGGPDFPKGREGEKASWKDERTCCLPVELVGAHYYRVGINSTSHRNFRSDSGVPALPSAIYFTTRGATEEDLLKLEAPVVVKIVPPNEAKDVDPSLTELRVTFSVPMGAGFSWCGSGENYAEIPEGQGPSWSEDKKTCILPVRLKPDWDYELGINCPSFRNFQSAGGIPVEPQPYSFHTASVPPEKGEQP